jgi:exopolysaccharide biosynthesis polyprenyl glycosylphosphotransferase
MILKRLFDICASALVLLLVSPLLLFTAILIKISSKGPILFAQERVGLNKRTFKMYKFRTMVVNAEQLQQELEHMNEAKGGHFKIRKDPRITPIGRILRKLSIDELPQLLNVLKGDMSLVGPRPLPLRDYSGMKQEWPRRRFGVRPGVTCLWQVEGRADPSISFEQWMELDMKYVDSWSLWLDFVILLRTVPAVFKGSGAY